MIVAVRLVHPETDRQLIQKQRIRAGLPAGPQVVPGMENQLVGSGRKFCRWQDRSIRAPVGIRDRIGDFRMAVSTDAVEHDVNSRGGATPDRIKYMCRKITRCREEPFQSPSYIQL